MKEQVLVNLEKLEKDLVIEEKWIKLKKVSRVNSEQSKQYITKPIFRNGYKIFEEKEDKDLKANINQRKCEQYEFKKIVKIQT